MRDEKKSTRGGRSVVPFPSYGTDDLVPYAYKKAVLAYVSLKYRYRNWSGGQGDHFRVKEAVLDLEMVGEVRGDLVSKLRN